MPEFSRSFHCIFQSKAYLQGRSSSPQRSTKKLNRGKWLLSCQWFANLASYLDLDILELICGRADGEPALSD